MGKDLGLVTPRSLQWVQFGILFVAVVSIIVIPLLRVLPKDTRRYFLLAGLLFVSGALGLESLGPLMLEAGVVESNTDTLYLIRRLAEEGCEMLESSHLQLRFVSGNITQKICDKLWH